MNEVNHPTTGQLEQFANQQQRILSIDFLRGIAMVLMAIDHVRVYSGIPAGGHTMGVFFTRWITHFCVPTFVLFAGTSAFLYGHTLKKNVSLSHYLLTRGMLLVFLELTLLRFSWTFNLHYGDFTLAGVIWMLGCCMMLMSLCTKLSARANGIIGLIIIIFQQVFQFVPTLLPAKWQNSFDWYWAFIYPTGKDEHSGISVLYVLVPWIGLMMTGYSFGLIMTLEKVKRNRICRLIGKVAIALFCVGSIAFYLLNPGKSDLPVLLQLLNQQKYPPSLLYLLMTLGPVILLIPAAEKAKGRIARVFIMFGRVPLFYYLVHIPLIHLLSLGVNFIREGSFYQDRYNYAPFTEIPAEQRWGLATLYIVFIIAEVVLYFVCRSYARYKSDHPGNKWLKYI